MGKSLFLSLDGTDLAVGAAVAVVVIVQIVKPRGPGLWTE